MKTIEEIVICPRCGQVFTCYNSMECWCSKIEIPTDVLKHISNNYCECLCKECIEGLIIKICNLKN